MLSVVVPALNAAAEIAHAMNSVRASVREVVVVDGGSADATAVLAEGEGATVLQTERGRGQQMAAGARAAAGEWLLFLHADTRLCDGWRAEAAQFMEDERNLERAAAFAFRLDDTCRAARRLERMVAWRCRRFGLPYGDQGLLISRALYDRIGGFRPLPLMEDVDIVRRIGRRNMVMLESHALTSAARYRRRGYLLRSARNILLLSLYFAGVPPGQLVRLYG